MFSLHNNYAVHMPAAADSVRDTIAISELLRKHPRGLSITEIAETLQLHRNTAAKYLDMLALKGELDCKKVGTAKNYFLARRMPVSALLHFTPHPVMVVDGRMEVAMVSGGTLKLLGCSLEVLYGEPLRNLPFPLFKSQEFLAGCHEAVQGTQAIISAGAVIGGARRRLRIHFVPIVFDTGRNGCAAVLVDETASREAVEALEVSRRRYEALTADQTEFVLHAKPDLTLEAVNEAFCRHAGRTREQLIGFKFLPLLPAEDRDRVRATLRALTPEEPIVSLEIRSIMTDGTLGRERWRMRALFGEEGRHLGYHLTGTDVTELKHCEDQVERYHQNMETLIAQRTTEIREVNRTLLEVLAEKEEIERELLFTQFAFDNASDSILLFDESGQIYKANRTACEMLGYGAEEILAVTIFDLNPSIARARWAGMWAEAAPGERERTLSVHRRKDGTIFDVEVSRTFVRFADRTYFCSIARERGGGD